MGERERLAHADVEGLRVGRFGGKIMTTCILWHVGDTLVDTGPRNQWRAVRRYVVEKRPRRVVVTHHHEDHAGNLAPLMAGSAGETPPELLAPEGSLELLAEGFPVPWYRRLIWGRPGRARAARLPAKVELPDGSALEPVLLPGHAPDMTCFLERRRRILFGADLYVARRQRYLRSDESLSGILASLRRALELDFDVLLCAHAGVVERGKERLRGRLSYLEELCGRAAALADEGLELAEISRRLLGPEDNIGRMSRMEFSKRNLVAGCLDAAAEGR